MYCWRNRYGRQNQPSVNGNQSEIAAELKQLQREVAVLRVARTAVFEFIEVFYNRQRLHSSLGYRSPRVFEAAYLS